MIAIKIILIRHGKTYGNLLKRYIGKTDEPLLDNTVLEKKYPKADVIVSSPLKRCLMTAKLIYPNEKIEICDGLSETDFGEFENKSYEDLKDNKYYDDWIKSGGKLPFPGGESRDAFIKRCVRSFNNIIGKHKNKTITFIIHGGTIMAVMSHLFGGDFYDYHVENLDGYVIETEDLKYFKL